MSQLARRIKQEDGVMAIRGMSEEDTDIRMTEAKKNFEKGLEMYSRWKDTRRNYHMRRAAQYLDKARRLVGRLNDSDDRSRIIDEATTALLDMTAREE